eukprot:11492695-Karenia_brevis.AAC.1
MMSKLARHLWNECGKHYTMRLCYVRSHSGDFGDEAADALAGSGADYASRSKWLSLIHISEPTRH